MKNEANWTIVDSLDMWGFTLSRDAKLSSMFL